MSVAAGIHVIAVVFWGIVRLDTLEAQESAANGTTEGFVPLHVWPKAYIPDPQTDVWQCGRHGQRSWVCDPNNLVSTTDADRMDAALGRIHSIWGCRCLAQSQCPTSPAYRGYQAAVVILNKINLPLNPTEAEKLTAAKEYTAYLSSEVWSYGRCGDHITILISKDDKIVYTDTGQAVKTVLSDGCVEKIYQQNKQYFEGPPVIGEGTVQLLDNYRSILVREKSCDSSQYSQVYIFLGVFAAIILLGVCSLVCRAKLKCPRFCRTRPRAGGEDQGQEHEDSSLGRQHGEFTDLSAPDFGGSEGAGGVV